MDDLVALAWCTRRTIRLERGRVLVREEPVLDGQGRVSRSEVAGVEGAWACGLLWPAGRLSLQ